MEKRRFRNTNEEISLLGFGCMRLPKLYKGKEDIDYAAAQEMIDYAYQNGVNYFDTAYPYHEGMSETFIGNALKKYPRESFYLANKMPGFLEKVKNANDAKEIFEEQLKKCQVDYFDFYLFHSLTSEAQYQKVYKEGKTADYLFSQKEKGKIRHLGFSFHGSLEFMEKLLQDYDWDFIQIQLNYLDWDIKNARLLYKMIEQKQIPCIIMEPVRGGNLVSLCEESIEILQKANPQNSIASWAIRFAASLPNVLTVLSGMSTMEQVKDNVKTISNFQPLSAQEYEILQKALSKYLQTGTILCTGCRYCMDCPSGVDIPKIFSIYNKCAAAGELPVSIGNDSDFQEKSKKFLETYYQLPEKNRAHHCIQCNKCTKHCPQNIKIPEQLYDIKELAAGLERK